jgi:RimJ/RimL family protein N-acetyltransferase
MTPRVRLKDGREVAIRPLTAEDNEKIYEMFASMSEEALRWGMPPYTRERIERWMRNIENLIILGAEHDRRLIGYAQIGQSSNPRRRGIAGLAIYLHQDYQGVGLGTEMTGLLLEAAEEHGVHKVNLETVADNEAAMRLFEKMGFEVEGRIRDSYRGADGGYHDIIAMGKILQEQEETGAK